jgi:hypothetical protein
MQVWRHLQIQMEPQFVAAVVTTFQQGVDYHLHLPRRNKSKLGHSLSHLIHAFAETSLDNKFFMAKWDIKDGSWQLNCEQGEEFNFAYVLLQSSHLPIKLIIPASLQMGWIESPAYFCAASDTSCNVSASYCQTELGSLPTHKFQK